MSRALALFRRETLLIADIAKTILYSATNVRGVFVCNKEEFKTCIKALEYGGVKPIIDKVSSVGSCYHVSAARIASVEG